MVADDRAGTVEVNGDIKGKKRATGAGAGGGGGGGGGGYSGGQSYEAVLNWQQRDASMGQAQGQPDLTNAQLAGPLRHASFVTGCGAPDDMKVTVRVAVRMGAPSASQWHEPAERRRRARASIAPSAACAGR